MVGGLVCALVQGYEMEEALTWGVASGAAAASMSGTDFGSSALVEELRDQVRLEVLEISEY
jgi:fructose-1-phosphate kinase PfkB-like protein